MTWLSIERIQEFYNETMSQADPRTDGYLFLSSPVKMLAIIGLYLFVVWQGPKWMHPYKPLNLRSTIIFYNFAMVLFSVYIFLAVIVGIIKAGGYTVVCDNMDKYRVDTNNEVDYYYVTAGWLFFLSKLVELLDTIFFILRKKNNQVTFLHVYHHAGMVGFTWIGVKFLPGGPMVMYPLINSFIHAVMYTYYGLAACGPSMRKYLWWKKYLTKMQISQFVIFLTQGVINFWYDCPYFKVFVTSAFVYTITILLLFINFYLQAYIKGKNQQHLAAQSKVSTNGTVTQNGELHVANGDGKKLD